MSVIRHVLKKLSALLIDAHKDWGGYRIENLGAPTAAGHALRRGDESLINHNTLLNYLAAEHLSLPNTIASVLTDHDLARHPLSIIPTMDDAHIPSALLSDGSRALAGDLSPDVDNTRNLGASDKKYKEIRSVWSFIDNLVAEGGVRHKGIVTKTAPFGIAAKYLTSADRIVLVDLTTIDAANTLILPSASTSPGLMITFIKIDASANALIIDGSGAETINGAATNNEIDAQYDTLTLLCDGDEWFIIARYIH